MEFVAYRKHELNIQKQGLMMADPIACPEYGAKAIDPCRIETEPQNEFTSGLFIEACEAI